MMLKKHINDIDFPSMPLVHILRLRQRLDKLCVSARMLWAAGRETTGVEDLVYSLMGLFDVNMPLLYGEGYKAFERLQENILSQNSDQCTLAFINLPLPGEGHTVPKVPYVSSGVWKYTKPFNWPRGIMTIPV
jgi:hypothetical protein